MSHVFFSEDQDVAFGRIKNFENVEEFKQEIEDQLGYKVNLFNVKVEQCIDTSEGAEPELIIPLSELRAEIDHYYIADIEPKVKQEGINLW